MKEETFNKRFNAVVLLGMAVSIIFITIFKLNAAEAGKLMLVVAAFGSLMGVASTVLAANAVIWTFVFGLIDVLIYSFGLFQSHMTAQLALHMLYFLPMEFVGFFQWRKRGADSKEKVKARRLKGKDWIKVVALSVVVMVAATLLSYFGELKSSEGIRMGKILLDAAITMANIVAIVLMSLAYMEQWYFWMIVNICSVAIWASTLAHDPASNYALVYMIKYIFYCVNAVNGIRIWLNLSRES